MPQMQLVTAIEAPLTLNDHAFELCREFIPPDGGRFFTQVQRWGDYRAEIARVKESQAGDIWKFILPFLKAHGLTDARMREFAGQHIRLLTGAVAAYRFLHGFKFPIFANSAGYRQVAEAVGSRLGFDREHIFATEADLDGYAMTEAEAQALQGLEEELLAAPAIEWPAGAKSPADLPEPAQEAVKTLDRIFLERLPQTEIGARLTEIKPMFGAAKAAAVADSLVKSGVKLEDTIYVGASRGDVQALKAVQAGGGLAIALNGEAAAVEASEVVVVSDCAWPAALLTAIVVQWGKDGVLEVAAPETRAKSRALILPEAMIEPIVIGLQGHVFNIYLGNSPNRDQIIQESEAMAARLRGEAIAAG